MPLHGAGERKVKMAKMTKMKASKMHDIVYLHGKGRMACQDFFEGHIKKAAFVTKMIEWVYTDPALEETFEPTMVWPMLPGTRTAILDHGLKIGYIDQETYDEIMEGLGNGN